MQKWAFPRVRLLLAYKWVIISVNIHLSSESSELDCFPRLRLLLASSESTLLLSVTCHAEKDRLTITSGSSRLSSTCSRLIM